jgi:hypothetical protein
MLVGFPWSEDNLITVHIDCVETLVVAPPKSTPLAVIVTVSEIIFASLTPVIKTDCGTFQLVALNVSVEVESVIASRLLETRLSVRAPFGFPES